MGQISLPFVLILVASDASVNLKGNQFIPNMNNTTICRIEHTDPRNCFCIFNAKRWWKRIWLPPRSIMTVIFECKNNKFYCSLYFQRKYGVQESIIYGLEDIYKFYLWQSQQFTHQYKVSRRLFISIISSNLLPTFSCSSDLNCQDHHATPTPSGRCKTKYFYI